MLEMRKPLLRYIVSWILCRRAIAFLTVPRVTPEQNLDTRSHKRTLVLDPAIVMRPRQKTRATKKGLGLASNDKHDEDKYLKDPKFIERNKRWIVIVDEESIRMAVGDFLYDQGYQVTACSDADSMLRLCSSLSNDRNDGELQTIPDAIIR